MSAAALVGAAFWTLISPIGAGPAHACAVYFPVLLACISVDSASTNPSQESSMRRDAAGQGALCY